MAYTRDARMLRTEILAMVSQADPAVAELLLRATWDGPRWHEPSGRVVLRLTMAAPGDAQRIMASSEAMAALHGRLGGATFGAPWAVTWHIVSSGDPVDPALAEMLRVAADAWGRDQ